MGASSWRPVLAAWAIVVVLLGAGAGLTSVACRAGADTGREWHGVTIPRYNPVATKPSNPEPEEMDADEAPVAH